ncbi:MAG TPA: site-2 protease family protein [Thermoanaerobaculia bacterium]|jgi:Zn-dependent protease|nr:site-2 protease family protein [Thermoanaerobaculia bacterium]
MTANLLFLGTIQLLLVLFLATLHEAVHARVAEFFGDPTPRTLGRVSVNPLAHLDLFGTVILPAALVALSVPIAFGWSRPVPIVARNLRRPGWHSLLVSASGPAANAAFAILAMIAVGIVVHILGPEAQQAARMSLFGGALADPGSPAFALRGFPVVFTLVQASVISAFLTLFHLLPIPPLDGGMILLQLAPPSWAPRLASLRPFGYLLCSAFAVTPIFQITLIPFLAVLNLVISL